MADNQDDILSCEFIRKADSGIIMEEIYRIHGNYLFRVITNQLHAKSDSDEAKECFNIVFMKLSENNCRRIRMFKGRSSFKTYLVAVCRNLIVDYFRQNANEIVIHHMDSDQMDMRSFTYMDKIVTPENQLLDRERKEWFDRIIQEALLKIRDLTPEEKLVIKLRFYMNRTYDEINRMTGIKNPFYILKCALEKIRKSMSESTEKLFFTLIEE